MTTIVGFPVLRELTYELSCNCMDVGRRSLDELKQMFFELKDSVFKKQSKLLPTACDTEALEELLKKNLGEHIKMRDVTKPK